MLTYSWLVSDGYFALESVSTISDHVEVSPSVWLGAFLRLSHSPPIEIVSH